MALTIDDILDKEFAVKGGGYDRDDVDQFLDEICDEMTNMQNYIADLEGKLNRAEEALQQAQTEAVAAPVRETPVQQAEPNLGATLESMFRRAGLVADDTVKEAEAKAEGIIKEAEEKASQILDDAQEERETIRKSLSDLKAAAGTYRRSFLEMLDKHREALNATEGIFDEEEEA
ncbi:MAG: DivIVA domain-containing protein [Clostridia bacterium]|nr:DivIVA domain-containing protein [Clostridia bacterium]